MVKDYYNSRGQNYRIETYNAVLKYVLLCFHVIGWLCGVTMFGVAVWVRSEEGLEDWIMTLDLYEFYAGIYILIFAGAVIMITALLGCFSALTERTSALQVFIATQVVAFILNLAGSAVLLDHATYQSSIQPLIRRSMLRMINMSQYEDVSRKLNSVQESIGCCGADGPNDYINLRRALPTECRDTVTGNAYFYGCVDELTWFLEDKGAWLAGLAMFLCLFNVVSIVLSTLLIHGVRRENEQQELMQGYRR